jgi:sugar lactone lactonase YvrE
MLVAAVPRPLPAVTPTLWTVESVEEFEKGRPDGVSIAAEGALVLSPAVSALNVPALEQSSEPFLWSLAIDPKGAIYAGGGKNGSVYRATKGGPGSVWYESGDLAVRALAVDKTGALYAGTLPQGKIVRITGEGKAETMYQPEDRYVWALAAGSKGELYAATGERGIIYKITGPGKAEVFFDSEEFHIVALALDAQGNLYAGSDGRGLLYRITPQGKASVLYDAPLREIAAVAVDARGVVYAVAVGAEGETPPQPLAAPPTVTGPRGAAPAGLPGQPPVALPGIEEPTANATITVSASTVVTPSGPPPKSELYRIDPDGTVVTLWSSASETALALALDAQGRPIVGTGEPARIRLITGPQQSTLLARLPPSQVTALLTDGPRLLVATSNVGRIYALDPAQAEAGTYLSEAWDADSVARWGRIGWRATLPSGSKVEIATRTGNSAVPDATWSDWSETYSGADGSAPGWRAPPDPARAPCSRRSRWPTCSRTSPRWSRGSGSRLPGSSASAPPTFPNPNRSSRRSPASRSAGRRPRRPGRPPPTSGSTCAACAAWSGRRRIRTTTRWCST